MSRNKVRLNKDGVPFGKRREPTMDIEAINHFTRGLTPRLGGISHVLTLPDDMVRAQADLEALMRKDCLVFDTEKMYDTFKQLTGTSSPTVGLAEEPALWSDHEMGVDGKPMWIPMNAAARREEAAGYHPAHSSGDPEKDFRLAQVKAMLSVHIAENHTPVTEYNSADFSPGDPGYRPYCCSCSTMRRMEHRPYGFQCIKCGCKDRSKERLDG